MEGIHVGETFLSEGIASCGRPSPPPPVRENVAMTGKSVIDDGIRWDRLDRERFDQMVEALLSRVHDKEGHEVIFPEGKGGDGGRDAIATVDGRTIVYQFKFYIDGLSTSGSSRKTQVKRSFKRALSHSPDEWVLVVPCKLTEPFRRLLRDLDKGNNVRVSCWDRPRLDSMFAKHLDLIALMKQDDLLTERARVLGRDALLLSGGLADAVAHRAATQVALNEMHPHWGVLMSEHAGVPTFTFCPKTRHAPELSPLGIEMQVTPGAVGDLLRARLGEVCDFGHPGVLVIPDDRIASFTPVGMEWAGVHAGDPRPDRVEIHMPSLETIVGVPVVLRVYDRDGQLAGTFSGEGIGGNEGSVGYTLIVQFFGCADLTFLMPKRYVLALDGAKLRLNHTWPGDAGTAARVAAFNVALRTGARFEIDVAGKELAYFHLAQRDAVGDFAVDRFRRVREFASDLARVQEDVGIYFDVPAEVSNLDRIWTRCVRLMLDGRAVLIPLSTFSASLDAPMPPGVVLPEDGLVAVVFDAGKTVELFGHSLLVPEIRCYHPRAEMAGLEAAFDDVTLSPPKGFNFSITATKNHAFLAYMPERYSRERLEATAWRLNGIDEPDPLPAGDDGQ